ncbi:MAG: FAD-dependent monooxygenase [Kibdelosporangium sp.]
MVPQEALERILAARAGELGIEIRRGVALGGFEQDDDGVTVQTSTVPLRARYLVGCGLDRFTFQPVSGRRGGQAPGR